MKFDPKTMRIVTWEDFDDPEFCKRYDEQVTDSWALMDALSGKSRQNHTKLSRL